MAASAIQVPRGKHDPGDVLAGAGVGWIAEGMSEAGLRLAERIVRR